MGNSWIDDNKPQTVTLSSIKLPELQGTPGEGSSVGIYKLLKLLGRGGMAEVYLAHRTGPHGFSRKVVVKRILPQHSSDENFVKRFVREASLAAQLHHPNIVEIIELGAQSGDYFIVMEYLHGRNVRLIIETLLKKKRRCPPGIAVQINCR